MELAPITTTELRGRSRHWGKELTVVDPAGNAVMEARLGKAATPNFAELTTAKGSWRIERRKRDWTKQGPRPLWWDAPARQDLVVLDESDDDVATWREGKLTLTDGESLVWAGPRSWT